MSTIKLSCFLVLISLICACQLNESSTPAPEPSAIPKIKEEITDSDVGTYFYNADGQVVEEQWSDGSHEVYHYSPGMVELISYKDATTITVVNTFILNSRGLCIEQSETLYGRTYYMEYDSSDRLVKSTSKSVNGILENEWYYFYNADGNLEKDSVYRHSNDVWRVNTFEYYPDIQNTLAPENYGQLYRGETSKNYRKKSTYTSSEGEFRVTLYLPPVLDENGRILEETITTTQNNGTGNSYTYSYTYY